MKFSVTYGRKIQIKPYEMLEISFTAEFDSSTTSYNQAKEIVKAYVDSWIKIEGSRLKEQ